MKLDVRARHNAGRTHSKWDTDIGEREFDWRLFEIW